jgi:hypothetical protein
VKCSIRCVDRLLLIDRTALGIYQSNTKEDFRNDVNGCRSYVDQIAESLDALGAIEERLPHVVTTLLQKSKAEIKPVCDELNLAIDSLVSGAPHVMRTTFRVVDVDSDPIYFTDGDGLSDEELRKIERVKELVQSEC